MIATVKNYTMIRLVLSLFTILLIFVAFTFSYSFTHFIDPKKSKLRVANNGNITVKTVSDDVVDSVYMDPEDIIITASGIHSCEHIIRPLGYSKYNESREDSKDTQLIGYHKYLLNSKENEFCEGGEDYQPFGDIKNISLHKFIKNIHLQVSNDNPIVKKYDQSCDKLGIFTDNRPPVYSNESECKIVNRLHKKQLNIQQLTNIQQIRFNNLKTTVNQNQVKPNYRKLIKFKTRYQNRTCKQNFVPNPLLKPINAEQIECIYSPNKYKPIDTLKDEDIETTSPPLIVFSKHISYLRNDHETPFIKYQQNTERKEDLYAIQEQLDTLRQNVDTELNGPYKWLQDFHEKYTKYSEALDNFEMILSNLINDFHNKFLTTKQRLIYKIGNIYVHLPFDIEIFNEDELVYLFENRLKFIYEIYTENDIDLFKKHSKIVNCIDNTIFKYLKQPHINEKKVLFFPYRYNDFNFLIIKIIILETELNKIQLNHISGLILVYDKWIAVFDDIFRNIPPEFEEIRGINNILISEQEDLNKYKYALGKRERSLETIRCLWENLNVMQNRR